MQTTTEISLNTIIDLLLDAICVVDAQGRFVLVSGACERIFGYAPEEMTGRSMIDFVFHEDREMTLRAAARIQAGQLQPHFENRYVRKDGEIVHIMWSARWSEADQVRVAVARDVTRRKHAETMQAALYAISEAAHLAENLPALFERIHRIVGSLLPAANFSVVLYDRDRDELSFPYFVDEHREPPGPQRLDSTTLSAEVIRTARPLLLTPENRTQLPACVEFDSGTASLDWLGVPLTSNKGVMGALVVQSHGGGGRYTDRDIELLQFVSSQIANAIERKQTEVWLQHIARHDPLTDLPNRELFHDRLQSALSLAQRNHTALGLLYLDLDGFKQVNDTLGHTVGDLLLQEAARRLQQCVRESDTVGRVGGDEFLVLLNNLHSPHDALFVAEKIRAAFSQPFELAGPEVSIAPSIGIALYPEHGEDFRQLIHCADEAMYGAKKSGGNRFRMADSIGEGAPPEAGRATP